MFPLLHSLHSIAEERGEGFHPTLLALLKSREEGVVADMSKKESIQYPSGVTNK